MSVENVKLTLLNQFKDMNSPIRALMFSGNNLDMDRYNDTEKYAQRRFFSLPDLNLDLMVEYNNGKNECFDVIFANNNSLRLTYPDEEYVRLDGYDVLNTYFIEEQLSIKNGIITFVLNRFVLDFNQYLYTNKTEDECTPVILKFNCITKTFEGGNPEEFCEYAIHERGRMSEQTIYADYMITDKDLRELLYQNACFNGANEEVRKRVFDIFSSRKWMLCSRFSDIIRDLEDIAK